MEEIIHFVNKYLQKNKNKINHMKKKIVPVIECVSLFLIDAK
jgi:uncharacterized protein YtpQ (UPF0354 family)